MPKILILGIGSAQVDAIKYCQELGLEVHACSYNEHGAGRTLVDHFAMMNITDIESVYQYACDHHINYVYSVGSDLAMPTIAMVSERLNLPQFVSFQTAVLCQHKIQMRAALGSGFEWNIPYMLIKTAADIQLWHEYPCMLKPADSQGQRGVFRLDSLTDFYRYYDTSLKFSRRKELIVEKFIDGPEISVNAYVKDHQFIFMQTTDRISFPGYPSGIIKKHQIPSVRTTPALERYIRDLMEQVIQTLDIANGPVYFQLKLSNNVPMLIEVTPRLDGCHLWRLIKYHTGVDLLAITFHHLIANKVPFQLLVANHPRPYRLEFFSEKPGAAVNRNQYTYPPALFLEWYYPAGETVQPINGYMEKIGYYIAEDN